VFPAHPPLRARHEEKECRPDKQVLPFAALVAPASSRHGVRAFIPHALVLGVHPFVKKNLILFLAAQAGHAVRGVFARNCLVPARLVLVHSTETTKSFLAFAHGFGAHLVGDDDYSVAF
jgi:hypothetical protein